MESCTHCSQQTLLNRRTKASTQVLSTGIPRQPMHNVMLYIQCTTEMLRIDSNTSRINGTPGPYSLSKPKMPNVIIWRFLEKVVCIWTSILLILHDMFWQIPEETAYLNYSNYTALCTLTFIANKKPRTEINVSQLTIFLHNSYCIKN